MAKEVKQVGSGLADLTKGLWNDVVKPLQNELNPITRWNYISEKTGGTGDVFKDLGDGLGVPRDWKQKIGLEKPPAAPAAAPAAVAAPKEAMPQMDAEAIARARRLAAMKSAGGGRAGTFLGGSGLGNG